MNSYSEVTIDSRGKEQPLKTSKETVSVILDRVISRLRGSRILAIIVHRLRILLII